MVQRGVMAGLLGDRVWRRLLSKAAANGIGLERTWTRGDLGPGVCRVPEEATLRLMPDGEDRAGTTGGIDIVRRCNGRLGC